MATVRVIQQGAAKPAGVWPYTLCIVANPWIRTPEDFLADPILLNEGTFHDRVDYILDSIFGRLPGQTETMFGEMAEEFRIISIFDPDRPRNDSNALVANDINTDIVLPRQPKFAPFLRSVTIEGMGKVRADVAFAVTGSASHTRCSALFTNDDDGGEGRDFRLDELEMSHRLQNTMPGAVALHVTAASIVALHEFGHAASSWTNGMVTDLYNDIANGINKRSGRPITADFCTYDATAYASSPNRGGTLEYPADWTTYHPELFDPDHPAVMDNFWDAPGGPERCRHDKLTRQFLSDRIRAIMSR